jgi:hypothetical protein
MGTEILFNLAMLLLILNKAGVLILQLLEGCNSNKLTFELGPEDSKCDALLQAVWS